MRKRIVPRVCPQCHIAFLPKRKETQHCCNHCARQARRDATPRVACPCAICGTMRMVKPSRVAKGQGKYCSKNCKDIGTVTHGERKNLSPEYTTWANIKTRCFNVNEPSYQKYGALGITMCDTWLQSFETFLADMGRRPSPAHSLDRYPDPHGSYTPENCRWATKKEQGRNRRDNRCFTLHGVTQCLSAWAEQYHQPYTAVYSRLTRGWDIERALTIPLRQTAPRSKVTVRTA